ncbi:collectin-12-like isoform X2 [Cloeon dipterum]|uniref:collectin-12-like isoform X2 n=1 Tax=Cloeon dipterum TaxID=197152 RepID=UPI00321F9DF6
MLGKSYLVATAVILLLKLVSGGDKGEVGVSRGYEEINGTEYYLSTESRTRDSAKLDCEGRNMTLVEFDGNNKWTTISSWISNNIAYRKNWYWTSGILAQNSEKWVWEASGEEIKQFFWAPSQPNENSKNGSVCINFIIDFGGWDDDYCDQFTMGHICE